MRILILDDDQNAFALTESLLKEAIPGVTILHAYHEHILFRILKDLSTGGEQPLDLILLELHIPGFNAHELIMALKENALTREIPVAFFSRSKNPKNYLFASRLNTPLFLKGERLIDQAQAIHKLINWYNSLMPDNTAYKAIL
ncbi:Response regulator receiver domain-containing protein [Cnuella takakiae]|uniref:Response regulator receiver domain-containing protein n=1 Tax=Cnuella takakiae TaxID=1302690 RepID=A0A1M4ZA44_9BACT|nr:response regulator [Cnuella takakiae]OLY94290.1 hypothetical protein BUE76_22170 [Cnuella takakiae]SHF14456.1 Response regulator receiver domain-containing protein [Cnuella takakiae]